jgi:hypothetical protein
MRDIDMIVVHCSDTPASMDIGVEEITRWHTDPKPHGNGWSDIGYHYVIRRNGDLEPGRPVEKAGAHARGNNKSSIGICLVGGKGGFNFTLPQLRGLTALVDDLQVLHGPCSVVGHRDLDSGKECPQFSVTHLLKRV